MPAVTDHASNSEYHRLVIAESVSYMTQAWVAASCLVKHSARALCLSSALCIFLHNLLQQVVLLILHCSLHSSDRLHAHHVVHQRATHVGASNTMILDTALHILMFLLCMQIAQLRTLLNVMNDIVRKCNGNALGMVMGDFNSTPQSAVYQFIKAGELDCQTVPRKHVSGQVQGTSWPAALEKVPPSSSLLVCETPSLQVQQDAHVYSIAHSKWEPCKPATE